MKSLYFCALTSALTWSAHASAGQIPDGVYVQTSSSVGDCPTCEITITKATPHIVKIASNNEWIGYASYAQQDDKYRGAFEWEAGKGDAYEGVVFALELVYQGKTLNLNAKSSALSFSATFRKK